MWCQWRASHIETEHISSPYIRYGPTTHVHWNQCSLTAVARTTVLLQHIHIQYSAWVHTIATADSDKWMCNKRAAVFLRVIRWRIFAVNLPSFQIPNIYWNLKCTLPVETTHILYFFIRFLVVAIFSSNIFDGRQQKPFAPFPVNAEKCCKYDELWPVINHPDKAL